MGDMNRREFVTALTVVAATACVKCESMAAPPKGGGRGPGGGGPGGGERSGPTSIPANGGATGGKIDIGPLSSYPTDGITDKFIATNKLAIIRNDGKLYAT